jgi:shikimate kinase
LSARHVVLVGLPGAGKSTVGPLVAAALDRPFLDFDQELERRVGLSVPDQFARDGEPVFRAREAELSAELAGRAAMILAPGGGWMANPAAADALRSVALVVYLRTSPAAALARLGTGVAGRPLLARAADPLGALTALLDRRASVYEAADHTLDTDGLAASAVANSVVALVTGREGS